MDAIVNISEFDDSLNNYKLIKQERLILIVCVLFMVSVCSKSSPLYLFNDWCDVQCYLTVGKSMFHGLVPYRDLIEHKGPLIFFIYGLAWIVSHDTCFGVYLLELVVGYYFLKYSYLLVRLCLQKRFLTIIPFIAVIHYTNIAFGQGGSAEECILPLLSYFLLEIVYFIKFGVDFTKKQFFIFGCLFGCVFWSKFNVVGFFIGCFIYYVIFYFNGLKNLLFQILYIIAGFVCVTIPWVVYFGVTKSIIDWLSVYLYDNIFIYSGIGNNSFSIFSFFSAIFRKFAVFYVCDFWVFLLCLLFILLFLCVKQNRNWIMVFCGVVCQFLLVYIGNLVYPYYSLPFHILIAPSLVFVCDFLSDKIFLILQKRYVLILFCCFFVGFFCTPNASAKFYQKKDIVQYKFKDVIEKDGKENPTLLNYGFSDGGFYTVTNIIPNCKIFCRTNLILPEFADLQNKYVAEGLCDYVITRDKLYDDKYEYVTSGFIEDFVQGRFKCYLYRKK